MTEALRSLARDRARDCCEYCRAQAKLSHDPFSVEHIIPLSQGGTDDPENLAWSCLGCNNYKYTFTAAYDLVTAQMVPLFNPRTDMWDEHFRWNANFTVIIGLTPTGRATVIRLQLNRPGLMNLRAVLHAAGKHPPE
ncbi:MAG: HNH endonuclease [Saprospiraceae bacterium]|nr:HNH endonuclease [Saprospiraceae bacterium]